jgi:hypothetical protein
VLGQLNGIWWITGAIAVPVPSEWASLVDPVSQTIIVEALVTAGPSPTMTATANGRSVTYTPVTADRVSRCD